MKSNVEENTPLQNKKNLIADKGWKVKDMILGLIYGTAILLQIIFIFFLYNYHDLIIMNLLGWSFLVLFLVIGGLPRNEFKKSGGIEKGKSYLKTTRLVKTGIYGIIRHPYWLSWILLSLSLTLLSQHWIMLFLGISASILVYIETFLLDKGLIKKFGDAYISYMKRVPRLNLIYGLIKKLFMIVHSK
jgi:protein-S-isoprenylcysteine O-methyltransferase Ste14